MKSSSMFSAHLPCFFSSAVASEPQAKNCSLDKNESSKNNESLGENEISSPCSPKKAGNSRSLRNNQNELASPTSPSKRTGVKFSPQPRSATIGMSILSKNPLSRIVFLVKCMKDRKPQQDVVLFVKNPQVLENKKEPEEMTMIKLSLNSDSDSSKGAKEENNRKSLFAFDQ